MMLFHFHPPFLSNTTGKVATDSSPASSTSIADQDGTQNAVDETEQVFIPFVTKSHHYHLIINSSKPKHAPPAIEHGQPRSRPN